MLSRILSGGATAATVAAVALILAARPAPAFTLPAPSLDRAVLNGAVDKVWWDRWGYWIDPCSGGGRDMSGGGRATSIVWDQSGAAGGARGAACAAVGGE